MKLISIKDKLVQVDDVLYDILACHKWFIMNGYAAATIDSVSVQMHNLVLGYKEGFQVDHIDQNKLNNCLSNLRFVTQAQNQWNTKMLVTNTSGYKGVSYHKNNKKWQAAITVNRKRISLGVFNSKEEAHQAYQNACVQYRKF